MAAPPEGVTATTWKVWDSLPEVYREADSRQRSGGGYPLLRYLSLLGDQVDAVGLLLDAVDYRSPAEGGAVGDLSQLLDPATAEIAWLPWLAQLYGVDIAGGLTVAEQRSAITAGASGWRAGSKASIIAAAQTVLSGQAVVQVVPHDSFAADGVRPFSIVVRTRHTETGVLTWDGLESTYRNWDELETATATWAGLFPRDVLSAVERAHVIPAGVVVRHELGVLTWARLEAVPVLTWNQLEAAAPTWNVLEDL